MIGVLFVLAAIAAIGVSFWSPVWGWGIAIAAEIVILIEFFSLKRRRWKEIPELSSEANEMLRKYGHFYAWPFGARIFSSSASFFQFASLALGTIDGFKGVWWGVGLAFVNFNVMLFAARVFNPTAFMTDPLELQTHEEIISYLHQKQLQARDQPTGKDT